MVHHSSHLNKEWKIAVVVGGGRWVGGGLLDACSTTPTSATPCGKWPMCQCFPCLTGSTTSHHLLIRGNYTAAPTDLPQLHKISEKQPASRVRVKIQYSDSKALKASYDLDVFLSDLI